MTLKQNITSILECHFSGFKDELIETCAQRIMEQIECQADEVVKDMFKSKMKLMPLEVLEVKGCATCEYDNTKSRYPCFNCMYNPTLMDEWRKKI